MEVGLLLFVPLVVGLIFLIILIRLLGLPFLRYYTSKHLLQDLPTGKKNWFLSARLIEPGGSEVVLEELLDENGNAHPMFNYGPGLDGIPILMITDPEGIREILVNHEAYSKPYASLISVVEGNGLAVSEGPLWKRNRRLITPIFHFSPLKTMIPKMVQEAQNFVQEIRKSKMPIDAYPTFSRITLTVLINCVLGGKFDVDWMKERWNVVTSDLSNHITGILVLGPFERLLPASIRLRRAMKEVDNKIQELMAEKRSSAGRSDDLLDALLSVRDEAGNPMDDKQIKDEVRTFLFAGHETTANLLSWCMYYLGKYPDIQEKLRQEVDVVLDGNELTEGVIGKLKYCEYIIKETLRHRSPIFNLPRTTNQDVTILGRKIPKGSTLNIGIQAIHMSANQWSNPREFIPERWSENNKQNDKRHEFAFIPFIAGAHNCIGKRFAIQEAIIILSLLVQNFVISTDDSKAYSMTSPLISPKDLFITFSPRK